MPAQLPIAKTAATVLLPSVYPPAAGSERPNAVSHSQKEIHRLPISRYAPPSVLVRDDLERLHYRGDTSSYFVPAPGGRASVCEMSATICCSAYVPVQRAKAEEIPVRQEGLQIRAGGRSA